ncbi:NUDIX domain-containing protein [Stutzerimonas zhaodongensis]|uniref:NUDIX domain-containing protein n=1 Tax=Stutzerimonas zhaodongensis TaxID=1176257 RepID=A0A3M2HRR6_9GAMM|nr:NUDIX domain-containing protein [Stutzerimonas zhaodongensis]MCQ4315409.1 NUDIX domain-containing protein [Stutzerimonas zhaodongensis]RMH90039.1 NUDIX domain-containing protein [Stutzerimonas zhaodongensis]
MSINILRVATACLLDEVGRLLIVRKRGTRFYMLPGGKIEQGEGSLDALRRELHEELGLDIGASALQPLGHFRSRAANEPDHWVEADVFIGNLKGPAKAQAEIETVAWLKLHAQLEGDLAPLLREQVIPALLQRLNREQ